MKNKTFTEKEIEQTIRENVNYDEAELWCNWSLDDLIKFVLEERQRLIEEILQIIEDARKKSFPYDVDSPKEVVSLQEKIKKLAKYKV